MVNCKVSKRAFQLTVAFLQTVLLFSPTCFFFRGWQTSDKGFSWKTKIS